MERFDKQIFFCLILIFSGGIISCWVGIHSYLNSSCCLAVESCHNYHRINIKQEKTIFNLEPPKINITCYGIVNQILDCSKINQYVVGCNYALANIGYYTVFGILSSFILSLICIAIFDVVEKYVDVGLLISKIMTKIRRIIKVIKYKCCSSSSYLVNIDDEL